MNRLENRVVRLERRGLRNGWRAYAGRPMQFWLDEALLGFLAESGGWPEGYEPTGEELRAIIAEGERDGEDGAV